MTRRSKKDRRPAVTQDVVAENVQRLRDVVYSDLATVTERNKELAKRADTSFSQIQRITSRQVVPGVDLIERIALALGVRPQDLLTPRFAMDVNPADQKSPSPPKL